MVICHSIIYAQLDSSTFTIRHFDDDFKERYSSDKFNYEGKAIISQTPAGSGNYEDYKDRKPRQNEENNSDYFSINLGPLAWLFYLAIAGAVIFLVYIIFNEGGTSLFTSKRNKKINNYQEITANNIENTDINSLIKDAENNQDFRLAIRYHYLLVLKTLSLKDHIRFEEDKTNSEYQSEVSTTPFSKNFAYTSYLYNYVWYGKFPLSFSKYEKAKTNFTTLIKQVNA